MAEKKREDNITNFYEGDLIVQGDFCAEDYVEVRGNLIIYGSNKSEDIKAKGSIYIYGNNESCNLEVGGDIYIFGDNNSGDIEVGTIEAKGNVYI